MERTPVRNLLEAIAGRTGLLECLEEGLTDKREIEERLNKSRSTINRWLIGFRNAGIITPEAEGHEVTLFGRIAAREYRNVEQRFTSLNDARPLLTCFQQDVSIDMRLLEGAEVLESNEIAPHEPARRLEEMVRRSEDKVIKGFSPLILPRYIDFFHGQVTNRDLEVEFVFGNEVLEYLLMAYYADIQEIIGSDRARILRLEGVGEPFGLVIIDDVGVWVGIYEPGGALRGAIINSTDDAFEWARETYDRLRERTETIEESDIMLRSATA